MCKNSFIVPGKKVVVMGGGITGEAAAEYALSCGAQVRISDSRNIAELSGVEKLKAQGVEFSCGEHVLEFLEWADIVLLSPGISYNAPIVQLVRGRGIPVYGELAVLAEELQESVVVAVTGSNGKTTVTSLIGWVLQQAEKKAFIGGNIGVPLYKYLLQVAKQEISPAEYIVAEVSSFQLECCGGFAPDIAVLLNITPDHIDRHSNMAGYIAAKMKIFANQKKTQCGIINGDNTACQNLSSNFQGNFCSFGQRLFNDALIREGRVLLIENGERQPVNLPKDGECGFSAENFAAAALALRRLGLSFCEIEEGFRTFIRPPHRMQKVGEVEGVFYINDSKATNTGAVIGALQQLKSPVVLIAGGRDKGEDYRLLQEAVSERVKALIVLGEAAEDIASALLGCSAIFYAKSMFEAVKQAKDIAAAGDTVLLSPACASFDMFSGYDERGRVFCECVSQFLEGK